MAEAGHRGPLELSRLAEECDDDDSLMASPCRPMSAQDICSDLAWKKAELANSRQGTPAQGERPWSRAECSTRAPSSLPRGSPFEQFTPTSGLVSPTARPDGLPGLLVGAQDAVTIVQPDEHGLASTTVHQAPVLGAQGAGQTLRIGKPSGCHDPLAPRKPVSLGVGGSIVGEFVGGRSSPHPPAPAAPWNKPWREDMPSVIPPPPPSRVPIKEQMPPDIEPRSSPPSIYPCAPLVSQPRPQWAANRADWAHSHPRPQLSPKPLAADHVSDEAVAVGHMAAVVAREIKITAETEEPKGAFERALRDLNGFHNVWDKDLWKRAWKEALERGRSDSMASLLALVRRTSERAVERGWYSTNAKLHEATVDLRNKISALPHVQWFGRRTVGLPADLPKSHEAPPPVLFCDANAIDLAVSCWRRAPGQAIVIVVEANDFDMDGKINVRSSHSVAPSDILVRTDFERYVCAAQGKLKDSQANMMRHLREKRDPYVFRCHDVAILRGSAEEGFPFLPEPIPVHVIVYALTSLKPAVHVVHKKKSASASEWYADHDDHNALLERLHLIGVLAQHASNADIGDNGLPRDPPVLIIGNPGSQGAQPQPRHAMANSLKHWRRQFSGYFKNVFVCCHSHTGKDQALVAYLDRHVNRDVERVAMREHLAAIARPLGDDEDEVETELEKKTRQKKQMTRAMKSFHEESGPGRGKNQVLKVRECLPSEFQKSLRWSILATDTGRTNNLPDDSEESDMSYDSDEQLTHKLGDLYDEGGSSRKSILNEIGLSSHGHGRLEKEQEHVLGWTFGRMSVFGAAPSARKSIVKVLPEGARKATTVAVGEMGLKLGHATTMAMLSTRLDIVKKRVQSGPLPDGKDNSNYPSSRPASATPSISGTLQAVRPPQPPPPVERQKSIPGVTRSFTGHDLTGPQRKIRRSNLPAGCGYATMREPEGVARSITEPAPKEPTQTDSPFTARPKAPRPTSAGARPAGAAGQFDPRPLSENRGGGSPPLVAPVIRVSTPDEARAASPTSAPKKESPKTAPPQREPGSPKHVSKSSRRMSANAIPLARKDSADDVFASVKASAAGARRRSCEVDDRGKFQTYVNWEQDMQEKVNEMKGCVRQMIQEKMRLKIKKDIKMKQRMLAGSGDVKRRVSMANADIQQAATIGSRDMAAEATLAPSQQLVSNTLRESAVPGRRNSNLRVEVRAGTAVVETDEQLDIRAETRKRLNKKGGARQKQSARAAAEFGPTPSQAAAEKEGAGQGSSRPATAGFTRPGSALTMPERPDSRQSQNSEESYARSEFWDGSPANSRPTSAVWERPASAKFERPEIMAYRDPAIQCQRLSQAMVTQKGSISATEVLADSGGFGDNLKAVSADASDDRIAKKCISKIRKSDMHEEEIVTYALRLESRLDILRDKKITQRASGNPWSQERKDILAAGQGPGRTALHGSAQAPGGRASPR